MYQTVDVLPRVIKIADEFVIANDRLLYQDFFKRIEDYVYENKLIIGGNVGMDLLISREYNKDNFTYELYTEDPWRHAKSLADMLYKSAHTPHIDKSTICVDTIIKNHEITISVNNRTLARLLSLPVVRGGSIGTVVSPINKPGHFSEKEVPCMPPEVQLMNVYRRLYQPYPPTTHTTYTVLLEQEAKLYDMFSRTVLNSPAKHDVKTGGFLHNDDYEPMESPGNPTWENETEVSPDDIDMGDEVDYLVDGGADEDSDPDIHHSGGADRSKQNINNIILEDVIKNGDFLLIGDFAICGFKVSVEKPRLQVLAADDIETYLTLIRKALGNHGVHTQLEYTKYALQIPNDFQTYKYTIYASDGSGHRTSIMDIFNSLSFELVPFRKTRGYKVAGIAALIRFKIIDLWSMWFVTTIGGDAESTKQRINDIIKQIVFLRSSFVESLVSPENVFQLDNYLGVYLDEFVEKRNLIGGERFKFSKYCPVVGRESE
jgi:hypothetical protein